MPLGMKFLLKKQGHNWKKIPWLKHLVDGMFMSDGVLYCKSSMNGDLECAQTPKLMIPEMLIDTTIKLAHEHPLISAHLSSQKTLQNLQAYCNFKNMGKRVDIVCRNCHVCLRKNKFHEIPHPPLGRSEDPSHVGHMWSMDTAGPLPKTDEGFEHVIVAVEHFTKFVVLESVKNISAKSILKFLNEKIISYFGLFDILLTDKHASYRSKVVEDFCAKHKIDHRFSSGYNPFSNGLCENRVKACKNICKAYCYESESNWSEYIPSIQLVLNSAISSTTKFQPFQLMFGRQQVSYLDLKLLRPRLDNFNSYKEFAASQVQQLFYLHSICRKEIEKSREVQAGQYNKNNTKIPRLKEGDITYLKDMTCKGLKFKFRGPYIIIIKVIQPN